MIDEHLLRECLKQGKFNAAFSSGVSHLMSAILSFKSVGIDITAEIQKITILMAEEAARVAHNMTDVDQLLKEALSIGDSIVKKEQEKPSQ